MLQIGQDSTMRIGEPLDPRVPWIRKLNDLKEARAIRSAGLKLDAMRRSAHALGDSMRTGAKVLAVKTLPLTTLIYPTSFAFNNAVRRPWPYVMMTHRALLVQVISDGAIRNILFNPTDYEAARETPFFAGIVKRYGNWAANKLQTIYGTVESHLAALGMSPDAIDVVAFDHFHTQDLRTLLGDGAGRKPRFPNAVLLAPRTEWEDWDHLHPLQQAWFIAEGKKGVPMSRVVLTDDDLILGDGCLLLKTPGHTSGNQTIFVHSDRGVFGCSENGTSIDNWTPGQARIPTMKKFAKRFGYEVVLNSNTPETWTEQYISMVVERSIVDRAPEAPEFAQMFPSSEVTSSWIAPGIWPAAQLKERDSGEVHITREVKYTVPMRTATA